MKFTIHTNQRKIIVDAENAKLARDQVKKSLNAGEIITKVKVKR